eukprot:gene8482-biopygen7119
MEVCIKYKVPVVISSLGAVPEVNAAIHSYGGIVLHDVINNRHANSAIRKGADGLIAVATGAGGHAFQDFVREVADEEDRRDHSGADHRGAVRGLIAGLDEDEAGGDEDRREGVEGGVEGRDVVERHGSGGLVFRNG